MRKRKIIGLGLATLVAGALWYHLNVFVPNTDASMNPVRPHAPYTVSEDAQTLHADMRVADLHTDTLLWRRDPRKRHDYGHADLPRLAEGGVDLQIFSAVTKSPRGLNFGENAADAPDDITLLALAQLWPPRTWNSLYERAAYQAQRLQALESEGRLRIVRNADDLQTERLATILLTEGAHPLEGDIANIKRLYDEGYRAMGLQHFFDNALGGSMHGQSGQGLTEFGREAVLEMVARNIIIDVAHSHEAVVRDVLSLTDAPIFISHGGVLSHCAASRNRNLPDDLTKAIAARGGIIGIGYFKPAICDDSPAGIAAAIVDAVDVLGKDAVALGSDFDGTVETSLDTSELAAVTQALLDRDVSEDVIRKVMGENAYAFFARNLPQ